MTEKILELFDLFFTFILIGSLIRQIPSVNKILISIEDILESGSKSLPNKTAHEFMLWVSKVFGFIALLFLILIIVISQLKVYFLLNINPKLYLYLLLIFCIFTYLWMAINVAKPTKLQLLKYLKSNVWFFSAPFLFLAFDLFFNLSILESFSQSLFNSILNIFGYQIPNYLLANFLAFSFIFYILMICQFIGMWLISQPPYFVISILFKIMKHHQKQERFLFLILLAFMINKLILILAF